VSEIAYHKVNAQKGILTKLEGKFNMKGVSEAMTVYGAGINS